MSLPRIVIGKKKCLTSALFVDGHDVKFLRALFGPKSCFSGRVVRTIPELANAALENAKELSGAVAVVRRGGCTFHEKVRRAQRAGAIAVIVVNTEDSVFGMGDPNNEAGDITIPAVMVPSSVGAKLMDGVEVKCVGG